MSEIPSEIDLISHQKFIDIYTKRHFRGSDPFELGKVPGYARDFYTTRRERVSRTEHLIEALSGIMRTSEKLNHEGKISTYARYLLVARSIELAFFGKHYMVI